MCVVEVIGMCPVGRLIVDKIDSRFGAFDDCDIGVETGECVGTGTSGESAFQWRSRRR